MNLFSRLFPLANLIGAVAILGYAFAGESGAKAVVLGLFGLVWALISGAIFLQSEPRRTLFCGILLAIQVFAVTVEAGVQFFLFREETLLAQERLGASAMRRAYQKSAEGIEFYPHRPKFRLVADKEVQPFLSEGEEDLVPLGGVSNSLVLDCASADGVYHDFTTDELGFRNPNGMWDQEAVDVALFGASLAQGACAEEHFSPAAHLRRAGFKTISGAVGGSGPLYNLAVFREYFRNRCPKVILWGFSPVFELAKLAQYSEDSIIRRYLDDADYFQALDRKVAAVDAALKKAHAHRFRRIKEEFEKKKPILELDEVGMLSAYAERATIKDFAFLRGIRTYLNIPIGGEERAQITVTDRDRLHFFGKYPKDLIEAQIPVHGRILDALKSSAESCGSKIIGLHFPAVVYNFVDGYRDVVMKAFSDRDIPIIDIGDAFSKHPNMEEMFDFANQHYTRQGYSVAGKFIAASLLQDEMFKDKLKQ